MIIVGLVGVLLTTLIMGTSYWHDEIILTDISKQPITQLMDTISTEPHPPGIYLFLKLFPVEYPLLTRILFISMSTIALALAIAWADKNKVLEKYNLYFGLALFAVSPLWTSIAPNVKQDAVTLPLFIIAFFVLLKFQENLEYKYLIALTLFAIIALFFGYLNFVYIAILLCIATIQKITFKRFLPLFFAGIIFMAYVLLFGARQYINNNHRLDWQNYREPTIVSLVYSAVSWTTIGTDHFSDICFILMGFAFSALLLLEKKTVYQKTMLLFLLFGFLAGIIDNVIVRNRYFAPFSFMFILLCGQGMESLIHHFNIKSKYLIPIILVVASLNGILAHITSNKAHLNYAKESQFVSQLAGPEPTGVLYRSSVSGYVRKIGFYPNNTNAIPINPFIKTQNTDKTITSTILAIEGNTDYLKATLTDVVTSLRNTGLKKFVYLAVDTIQWGSGDGLYDTNLLTLQGLESVCEKKNLQYFKDRFILVFDNCNAQ
ncbi:hypothetical protein A3K34_04680 [candidate division WWE3 bacterium RIFOXYC1_FULL_40_10]|uniref:Glycosyltransferase RgtA/B/C/D-like domain-containing protein n=1 Tax=candidate division WWE3 bacterium RIFOXYA2_FULL_46_9 TaxID=1802636 RepID=A0A1F4W149_UNCKA|nr:MAG: hypothetical protein A3K58_04680 [candidate division WWE3 bacterium RIFOXYB1_FULL_40_22]OGC62134.1 MAG: hypothetical protein A3K37_04680 [candidate division WWE3 bacterium RIFOXYA1_FULL_40_11]OGC63147.1 MAG: hypothetical protein A2264_00425 [candidate division WWE3 bacterium RIFOXYA2_FULL_46_9]OGC64923.1 MAG: hypothetical protein A2326_02685 [candidate division WWE3 bacterium RIFOXYB2_FULL_41_6]OGC66517.1 MAG: hypothetical protein A3K34_04680 [candidate division WWE3 bacterium RIFOXYC1_